MALPDDGRRDLSDNVTIGNAISAKISPAFVKKAIFYGLVQNETCPDNTNVVKFRIGDSLVAEAVTEGAVYTATDANTLLTDTSVTATASKVASVGIYTVESERFGAGATSKSRYAEEMGNALARKFDASAITLIDSITAVASTSGTLDTDTVITGIYNIENADVPPGALASVISPKQANDLKKLVANSGAAIYSTQYNHPFLGAPAQNGFKGNWLGVDFYQTTGLTTIGVLTQGIIFNPLYAFGAALGGAVENDMQFSSIGVASQIPGFSTILASWMYYGLVVWRNEAASELRSL